MSDPQITVAEYVAGFTRDADLLEREAVEATDAVRLDNAACCYAVRACRRLVKACELMPELLPMRQVPGGWCNNLNVANDDDALTYWRLYAVPQMRANRPDDFLTRRTTLAPDCRLVKTDDLGRVLGKNGKPVKLFKDGTAAEPALVSDDWDAGQRLESVRQYAREWAEVCHIAAKLLAGNNLQRGKARHSKDFTSVHWFGVDHAFTKAQAAAVEKLWAAWTNGTPTLAGENLTEQRRLIDVFRSKGKNHPAWGTMIVESSKGIYRLAGPEK
jgi:hypothetical protein